MERLLEAPQAVSLNAAGQQQQRRQQSPHPTTRALDQTTTRSEIGSGNLGTVFTLVCLCLLVTSSPKSARTSKVGKAKYNASSAGAIRQPNLRHQFSHPLTPPPSHYQSITNEQRPGGWLMVKQHGERPGAKLPSSSPPLDHSSTPPNRPLRTAPSLPGDTGGECRQPAAAAPVNGFPIQALELWRQLRHTTKLTTTTMQLAPYPSSEAAVAAAALAGSPGQRALDEPKSDEHCPMTGPLTVCDRIGSYPADVILDKLVNARRLFKQHSTSARSGFNLDSLFSDERRHSSEPFVAGPAPAPPLKQPMNVSAFDQFVELVEMQAIRLPRYSAGHLDAERVARKHRPRRQATDTPSRDQEVEPICRAKSMYVSPRVGLNDKGEWKYVVNAPERDPLVRQVIRVDICEQPSGAPCSDLFTGGGLPFGYSSQCKQKYSKKRLLALDSRSGQLELDTFFVPSCCVCQLVRAEPGSEGADNSAGFGDDDESTMDAVSGDV